MPEDRGGSARSWSIPRGFRPTREGSADAGPAAAHERAQRDLRGGRGRRPGRIPGEGVRRGPAVLVRDGGTRPGRGARAARCPLPLPSEVGPRPRLED